MVEQRIRNALVGGSTPLTGTNSISMNIAIKAIQCIGNMLTGNQKKMFITRCQQIFRIIAGLLLAMAFSAPAFAQNATDDSMSPTDITRMLQNEAASTSAEPEEGANVAEPKSILSHPALMMYWGNSGSMKSNDPQFLTPKAVTEFINQLDYSTRLGIVIFDQKVTLAHPLTEVSEQSRSEMLSSLDKINYKGLYTMEARHYSTKDVNESLAMLHAAMGEG